MRVKCPVAAFMTAIVTGISLGHPASTVEQDITTGGLHGTLSMPTGVGPVPAMLILAGSGPVDGNGNLPGAQNNSLKLLAQELSEMGIASLRVDKRGVAASKGAATREEDLRFDTYVNDAVAWLQVLRAQPRVAKAIVLDHSEGALVATFVAQRGGVDGLVLLAGVGEPAVRIIERQLSAAGVATAFQEQSRHIATSLERGVTVASIPLGLMALYRPSVQNYLMSWLPLDPVTELSKVTCPALVLQGTTDLQVSVDDASRLASSLQGSTLLLLEGMNHILKVAPIDRQKNLITHTMPDLPLAPALVPAIVAFVRTLP